MALEEKIENYFNQAQDRLVTQASDLSLETIAAMVRDGSIDLEPTFQRRRRWNETDQSQLIESFLLNVPVPPVYLSETDYGDYSVIDGKQRVNSINKFMQNELKLKGLNDFEEIEGYYFKDLPDPLKNALKVRPYLRVISLLRQSEAELKFEVFTRLNRGGEELNPQEIRNVVYRGRMNDLIYELGENSFLRQQLKITNTRSAAFRKMRDAKLVLRFFTLSDHWEEFSGDFRVEMNNFMDSHLDVSDDELEYYRNKFERAIRYAQRIWGERAFQRPDNDAWRKQLLSGMYDAQMIAIDESNDETLEEASGDRELAKGVVRKVFENDDHFENYVRRATNTPERVRYRISKMIEIIDTIASRA